MGLARLALRGDLLGVYESLGSHGDLAYVRFGHHSIFMVSDPECIHDVLVTDNRKFSKGQATHEAKRLLGEGLLTSDGDLHRRQRKLIQPAFHPDRLPEQAAITVESAERASAGWSDGQTIDVGDTMMNLTLRILGTSILGVELGDHVACFADSLNAAVAMVELVLKPWGGILERFPLPLVKRFEATRKQLYGLVDGMIQQRRAELNGHGDLVSLLLRQQDHLGSDVLNDVQIRDELVTILLTGHETLTQLMTWTYYLLASHPEVEARLHAELDSVIGDEQPHISHLPKLAQAEMILLEAMRIYPPVYALQRRALVDYELKGYPVPKGSLLVLSQYLLHRSPQWFSNPEEFAPSRWEPDSRESHPGLCYFPFGRGPRACIGEAFAMMQAKLLLAALSSRWSMRLAPGDPVGRVSSISLRPSAPVRVTLHRR